MDGFVPDVPDLEIDSARRQSQRRHGSRGPSDDSYWQRRRNCSSTAEGPEGDDNALLRTRLIRTLGEFPTVIASAAELREPHRVARYLEALASAYHKFYDSCRVLPMGDEEITELHRARWREAGGSASFATPEYVEFHRRTIKSAFPIKSAIRWRALVWKASSPTLSTSSTRSTSGSTWAATAKPRRAYMPDE